MFKTVRKLVAAGVGALTLLAIVTGPSQTAANYEPIAIGEGIALQWGTFYIADHFKLWQNYGLHPKPLTFASGRLVLDAILGGAVDIGTAAETPVVFAAINGLPVRIVATSNKFEPFDLVATKNIKNGGDLKGKKIGISLGTNAHYFLFKLLKSSNLSISDVTVVNLSPSDYVSALVNGSIDAFIWTEPHVTEALAAGGGRFHSVQFPGLYLGFSAVVVTAATLETKRELITNALRALVAADKLIATSSNEMASIIAQRAKLDAAIVTNYMPRVSFTMAMDKGAIVNEMIEQANWALAAGIVRPGAKVPDFNQVVSDDLYTMARSK
jgi:ABC-type nitrate/sulfonate/bicarbonate transport system substrate-binding protein